MRPNRPVAETLPAGELEQKCNQMMQLQVCAFDLAQQGKKLTENLQVSSKKISKLLASTQAKISQLQEKSEADPRPVADEAQELRTALESLGRTGYSRDEEAVKEFNRQLERAEEQVEEVLEYLASAGSVKNLEQSQVVQVRELELSGSKVVALLEQVSAARSEMQKIQSEMYQDMIKVPELLQEVDDLREIDRTIVIEELDMMYAGLEEIALAAEVPDEQTQTPSPQVTDYLGVKHANPLALTYAAHWKDSLLPFDPPAVLQVFSKLLAVCTSQQLEVARTMRPLFQREFSEDPEQAIAQFLEGLRLCVRAKLPCSSWMGDMVGVFTTRPIAVPVLQQVLLLNAAIEPETRYKPKDVQSRLRDLQTGGQIPLATVLGLLGPVFLTYPQYSAKLWDWLKPLDVSQADYLHFLVVYHMQAAGIDAVTLFKQMTTASRLSSEALRTGLSVRVQLSLSDATFEQLVSLMENPESHVIRRLDFLKFVKLEVYASHKDSAAFQVPRYQVLFAFTEVCRLRRQELATLLKVQLRSRVSPEAVEKAVRALGDTCDLTEALKEPMESFEEALQVLEQHKVRLGAYFCKR